MTTLNACGARERRWPIWTTPNVWLAVLIGFPTMITVIACGAAVNSNNTECVGCSDNRVPNIDHSGCVVCSGNEVADSHNTACAACCDTHIDIQCCARSMRPSLARHAGAGIPLIVA